jgi:BolA protein
VDITASHDRRRDNNTVPVSIGLALLLSLRPLLNPADDAGRKMSVKMTIEKKLLASFQPVYLQVDNESHLHSVPPDSETHFKLVIVSDVFSSLRAVARHQAVYKVLADELQHGVHALALHTYSPVEWQQRGQQSPDSPDCMGGSKHAHHAQV